MPDLIRFDNVSKHFAGVVALAGVTLSIKAGETHALMGENGAGKSTLSKLLAGIHRPDGGRVLIDGQPVNFRSPADAARAGIGMVHQELAFCPDLTVAENLCLGQYPRRAGLLTSRRGMRQRAGRLLEQIGVTMDVTQPMRALSTAREQLVQIAAAVGTGARVLIFDEPTSSLSKAESEHLFKLIFRLKRRGVTIVYVSHRLPEVFFLCDRISVLRDGAYVGTLSRSEASEGELVRMMIGRPLEEYLPQHVEQPAGREVLRVGALTSPGKFENVWMGARAGEIVGLAGLVGAGRSEVAQAIFGLDRAATGNVEVAGRSVKLGSVRSAMDAGAGYVPEDRKRQGLVLKLSGRANFSLQILDSLRVLGLGLNHRQERLQAQRFFDRLNVKTPSIDTPVEALSGGNQQKVVLAKWLARKLKLLIVDEPTRGVDVGAKAAIHGLIDELAQQGLAVILISSDLPELLHLASRVLVMREGRLVGKLSREEADQERVMRLMAGVSEPQRQAK